MTNQNSQRRIFPVTAKLSEDETLAFENLRDALGARRIPVSTSDALRHALKVACQAEKIDWPAVDS